MEKVIEKIILLIKQPGFFYAYLLAIRINLFFPENAILKLDHQSMLNFQEIGFISGLLLKYGIDIERLPSEENIKKYITELHQYLEELHYAFIGEIPHSEPIFYGDSGVYDFQYIDFAPKIYENDKDWLKNNKNIDLGNCSNFWKRVLETIHNRINSNQIKTDFVGVSKKTLEDLSFERSTIPEEFMQYFDNFSCTPLLCNQGYGHPMGFNQLEANPFIKIDEKYFLPISFLLAKALYTTPFYWIGSDLKYYNSIGYLNRGKSNETLCLELAKNVVGTNNSYKNVIIKDSNGNDITEVDTLLIVGNRVIIIQAKAKKLTELAKRGDTDKLEQDFKEAIQDAYDQGLLSREKILEDKCSFRINGKQLIINDSIQDAYILCVTLDHYPSVIFQSNFFLKQEEKDPRPVCISIFDLEIICHYLKNRFEFLFYIHQRVNYGKKIMAESEISLLGLHLNQKLYFDDEYGLVNIGNDFGALIDVHFPVEKGWHQKTDEYEKLYSNWGNKRFSNIVTKIIETKEPGYTDAILFLYSIGGESIDSLIQGIDTIKDKTKKDGKVHDYSALFGNKGITIKVFPKSYDNVNNALLKHCMARKYKSKGDLRLGLGFYEDSSADIDFVCFSNTKWKEDMELEKLTKEYLSQYPQIVDEKFKPIKIGRNQLCPCGSGKKYKKCCL